ncbi:endonuclease MutS2 [Helicobacter sp. 11S02596-1]|uniref:endonuclease MutS2 n=1 Tax=Helicobacter sp. 11S02596-1 TaxID=1476194 RepID=UPI000BA6DBE3|nr:endonuclease MutS2 [Helicobacter sp. 11S02596-1]PAF41897.1 endonuclease MutS2 [Helicobacter sp. 11S02596-1]
MQENHSYASLIDKLDLREFIASFEEFFARKKPIHLEGDRFVFGRFIAELDTIDFTPPPKINPLDTQILHLKKIGVLKLEEIFEFIKIIRYFGYLKSLAQIPKDSHLCTYLQKIEIPPALWDLMKVFEPNGQIKAGIYAELDSLEQAICRQKAQISKTLSEILSSQKLSAYFVDKQIHYINGNETLLLKAGFHHAISGIVISRSQGGFFYLLPQAIHSVHQKISELNEKLQICVYEICKNISAILGKQVRFLDFINKEFDKFDHLQARVFFAKAYNLEFVINKPTGKAIVLKDFSHPALSHPKPISIDFSANLLMITGVNAGGKTMLLKSILTSVFLSKHLLPMKINAFHSKIPHFKNLAAIISDPQNSKNDISTFAGRMVDFSKILTQEDILIGIDEIELGTDADEGSSLYKVLLEFLLDKNAKIIITTHHKRLAALMAQDGRIQMCAAIFNEERQLPTYEFLHGSIGKSYAFETAKRYGIPENLIKKAKEVYGKDKERLNELIEKSAQLEISLKQKACALEAKIDQYERKKTEQQDLITKLENDYAKEKSLLQRTYQEALNQLKQTIKDKEISDIHRNIHHANKILNTLKKQDEIFKTTPIPKKEIKIGDRIKYGSNKGVVVAKNGDICQIQLDEGMKLKIEAKKLKLIGNFANNPHQVAPRVHFQNPKNANVSLDLHGYRAEEAIEKLDIFLSDALIAGFDEVMVYHGIGTGKLAFAIKEFLSKHPKVLGFCDAPPQMGGFGAKIIKL